MDIPGTSNYPDALDTALTLLEATNAAQTTLTAPLGVADTTATVASTASFPDSGVVVFDGIEIAFYTGKTPTSFTGLIRGADGTTAQAHEIGDFAEGRIIARHHMVLSEAIRLMQSRTENLTKTDSDFSGQIDGINVDFITTSAYKAGTAELFLNGLRQISPDDFAELNSTTLRLTSAPMVGDRLIVSYIRS